MAKHGKVKDSGEYFVINPASRKVTVPHVHKSIGTVGDHNSEQITFECPQMIDSHDISQCTSRYVTWINVRGEVGHDELQIAEVEQGKEGMLYLSWTIRNGLTVAKGIVQFSVHFEDFDEDGETLYRWSTATCKDCDILDSVNAVLGAYQAIYVAGDTLVIEDYTLVKDGVLELETNGLVPEGTLEIKENGSYDVGKYAQAIVNVKDDPELIPENIKKGVNILGVEGAYDPLPLVSGSIVDACPTSNVDVGLVVYYSGYDVVYGESFGIIKKAWYAFNDGKTLNTKFVKDLPIIIMPSLGANFPYSGVQQAELQITLIGDVELIQKAVDGSLFVVRPLGENFTVRIHGDEAIG